MSMTWTSLKADVAEYLDRSDLTARIPSFIELAEKTVSRVLKPEGFERYATFTITSGDAYITRPERYRGLIHLYILVSGDRRFLEARTLSYVLDYWPDESDTGVPEYVAPYGKDNLIIAPTPGANYANSELGYYEDLEPLGSGNATNWLTEFAPNLLLYGTLLEASPYLKGDARIGTWKGLWDQFAQALIGEERWTAIPKDAKEGQKREG